MSQLRYRGVSYDNSQHEQRPSAPIPHVYRGRPYEAPLRHDPAPADPDRELHYRGHLYRHLSVAHS